MDIRIDFADDSILEGTETLELTIVQDPNDASSYSVGSNDTITVTLFDNEYVASESNTTDAYQVGFSEDVPIGGCSCQYTATIYQSGKIVLSFEVEINSVMNGNDTLTIDGEFAGKSFTGSNYFSRKPDDTEPDTLFYSFEFSRSELGEDDFGLFEATLTSSGDHMDGGPKTLSGFVFFGPANSVSVSPIPKLEEGDDGITLAAGETGDYYADDGIGGYETAAGTFSSLAAVSGGYEMTTKDGAVYTFDSDGYALTKTDTKGRVTTYSYITYGDKKLISSIVEPTITFTFSYSDDKLTSASTSLGDWVSLAYSGDLLSTVTRSDPDGAGPLSAPVTTYSYDGNDRLTSKTANGLTTTYTYDSTGRLASVQTPDGADTGYVSPQQAAVSGGSAIETVTGNDGISVQRAYDSRRNVTREIDALGNATIFERDANGLLLKKILPDPDGAGPLAAPVYEYTYDSRGNKLTETLPDKSVRTWIYHSTWNQPIQYTDANGNITLYEYDTTYELLLSKTSVIGEIDDLINQETDDLTTSYTYTPAPTLSTDAPISLIASMTAPDGMLTEYEYDEDGNRTKTTYAVGTADEAYTSATYDSNGSILTETDELGNTTTYTYDDLKRRLSITTADPDGAGPLSVTVTSYTYNAAGLMATQSVNGRTTTYEYDSKGRLETVTEEDPDDTGPLTAPETSYTYDSDGRVLTTTDPLGNVTTNAYTDDLLTSVTGPDPDDAGPLLAPVTSYTYDDNGQILTITDPLNRVTTYEYDDLGRQISVTYPDPDGVGTLVSLTETTEYDLFGRVSSRTDTAGVTTSYTYDHEGNMLTETTPLGTTTYAYDELNRQIEVETADPDDAGPLGTLVTVYAYNAAGMLASVTTPKGTTNYGYDNRRRRTSVTQADPDGTGPLTAPVSSTTYDDAGNVLTETDALGNVTSYQYDALNRVIEITSPDPDGAGALMSPVTSYEYDEFGQLVSMTDPNGGVTTYVYDDLGRKITEISPDPDDAGALTSPEVSYAYDANGQLVSMTDELGNVTTYEYDNLGRQITVTLPDPDGVGSATAPVTTYKYDAAGQLSSVTDPLGRKTSYTYDAMGRTLLETLPDPDEGGPLVVPFTSYTYGSDGRLASVTDTEGQTVSYTYTSSGQVATMTDPRGTTFYSYDAIGRQLTVTEPDPDGAGPLSAPSTTYIYDNVGNMVGEQTLDGTTRYEYDNLGRVTKVTQPNPDGPDPESIVAPAIEVYEYSTDEEIENDASTFDFGTTPETRTRVHSFVVENSGTSPLELSSLSVPSGYTLLQDFQSTTLQPGERTIFSVRLDSTSAGTFSGDITFSTNVNGSSTFEIPVTGTVVAISNVIVVNSTRDLDDSNTSDGVAWTGYTNSEGENEVTLRAALAQAYASPGIDQILFDIPTTETGWNGDWFVIEVAQGLTQLGSALLLSGSDGTLIRADSQPGYAGSPLIELRATNSGYHGIHVGASGGYSEIRGLSITGFSGAGINVGVSNTHIAGNYIGVRPDGTAAGDQEYGIFVADASYSTIGVDGDGINDDIERNVIVSSKYDGIRLEGVYGTANHHVIAGNYIGIDPTGASAMANNYGIEIVNASTFNLIGTNGDGINDVLERNVISGNTKSGIRAYNNWGDGGLNQISGNYIGTDATGMTAVANQEGGILQSNGSTHPIILGTDGDQIGDDVEGNLISGNLQSGVTIGNIPNNIVSGNLVGLASDGVTALGNQSHGIYVLAASNGNQIGSNGDGWSDEYEGNIVAHNGGIGINISQQSNYSYENSVRRNLAYDNTGLNIGVHSWAGQYSNDAGDGDGGTNYMQNYPVITLATETAVSGTLNSNPNETFTIDFYGSSDRDANDLAVARTYLGTITVTTDANGDASFADVPLLESATYVSAIATDVDGNSSMLSLPTLTTTAGGGSAPEITVEEGTSGGAELFHGTSTVSFGTVKVGDSVSKTFTITNDGTTNLTIGAITLPSDFVVTQSPDATVTPGSYTTFTVEFTPSSAANYAGDITIATNDANESSFKFYVTAVSEVGALAPWMVYEYDALGRTISETDHLGHETSYDYDNLGRLIKKTDAEGGETEYTYDANGNRLTLTDPEENTTTWTYDLLNRMLTNTNELNDTRYYEYDAAGNLVEYTDRNGRVIEYEYDDLHRRIAENWMDGITTVHTITYSYDAASQLTEASDTAATYTFTYDRLGRNTSTEHDLAALGFDVVIDEAYDALGRRTSLTAEIDGTDDLENIYAYDYLNRMTQVTQGSQSGGNAVAEKRVDFTYDAEDKYQFTSITRFADLAGTETVATTTYGYDYADQLTSLTHADGSSSTLAGYTYSYDAANRLTAFTVYGHSAEDATYSYDDTDQLTGADRSGTTSDESYTYDDNGNRTGGGHSTGDNNQILSDGTYNYTYDDEGNRLTKTNISTDEYEVFEYDYRNRLVSVTNYDDSDIKLWKVSYGYDSINQLVSREVDTNGNGTVDESGYFIIDNGQIVLVLDNAGDVEHRMLWGPQVDQLLADENAAGDVLWTLTDPQNTVRDYAEYDDLLDETSIVNHIAYDAVGKVASETSGALDAFRVRYTGKYVDPLTDLQYNLHRWYDPVTARWISQDPIGFNAGDANLYRYVGNEYVNAFDSSGLFAISLTFGAFIPIEKGEEILENPVPGIRWGLEPSPWNISPIKREFWMFGTDNRERAGEDGSYRMRSETAAPFDSTEIGHLEQKVDIDTMAGASHRLLARYDDSTKKYKAISEVQEKTAVATQKVVIRDVNACTSTIEVGAAAPYPFMPSPDISYSVTWTLSKNSDGTEVLVTVTGRHDWFPAYEGLVNNHVVYSDYPEASGPGANLVTFPGGADQKHFKRIAKISE
ncbi:choice-of-anchor D domain-containing protein [Blastopirellula retiformator]|nr:choice-of-anchor D domain-containing protein [Blastopirellula retiformator]